MWAVTQGTLSVVASKENPASLEEYRVTVKLADVRFRNPMTQDEALFAEIVFWDVIVGWQPG